jgi:hypothetical protein
MDISHTNALERIARVLAGMELSRNGDGDGASVGPQVDDTWREHLDAARAILNSLREPDQRIAAAGDGELWTRMVRAALGEAVEPWAGESRSWEPEPYQKPLG